MTRSGITAQDSIFSELEEVIRAVQNESKKDKDELREEMRQNALQQAIETRNMIREELRSIFGDSMPKVGPGGNDEVETSAATLRGKGILPNPRERANQYQGGGSNSNGSLQMDSFSGQEYPKTKSTIDSNQSEAEAVDTSNSKSKSKEVVKRKPVRPRSPVWDHFTKFTNSKGKIKGKCNCCSKEFCCDPKKNGTIALKNHMNVCKKHPHAIETKQTQLALQPNSFDEVLGDVSTLSTWKYDEDAIREALVQMIIIDELSFTFVDGEGFRRFMRVICPSHKGDAIGRSIETCLLEWGLDKIFIITVDNASSNDVAISYLKKKLANWGVSVANSTYLHMRCMAHIINLVVMDGLKDVSESVMKVKDAVRYIRSFPARLKKFKECVEYEKIEGKASLCLDVPTRWNLLNVEYSSKYERAFERYESQEPMFKLDIGENGITDFYDWSQVKKMADMLSHFYELTLRISGSHYVTSNMFFSEISDLAFILNQWIGSNDIEMKSMGKE
ncbi:hypothetical protein GH714_017197 [Hevea brasiliensis]|uniref:BED-type domain-containing protein n=1 Tax=Hevea brasiliensis TaxID=3981 RepID=A0A6A6MEX1_HEVBR|nr:hypothetical protein GH714_017197 [Hevea brasiliensis]